MTNGGAGFLTNVIIGDINYDILNNREIKENFTAMNNDLSLSLVSLKSGILTRDEFISVVETCNKIITDAETFHLQIIQRILNHNNPRICSEV